MLPDEFVDYYEILQISPSAEPEVIEGAYKKLAQKYHPDINHTHSSAERMKEINIAHDVLSDPVKREKYHLEWLQRKEDRNSYTRSYHIIKPKPIVKPSIIHFVDMEPGQIKGTSFIMENEGGTYNRVWLSKSKQWLRILNNDSITSTSKLPFEVKIEATGLNWGETSSDHIIVNLDNTQASLAVQIRMKPKPKKEAKPKHIKSTNTPLTSENLNELSVKRFWVHTLLLSVFLGFLGVDRYYIKQYKKALLKALFLGIVSIIAMTLDVSGTLLQDLSFRKHLLPDFIGLVAHWFSLFYGFVGSWWILDIIYYIRKRNSFLSLLQKRENLGYDYSTIYNTFRFQALYKVLIFIYGFILTSAIFFEFIVPLISIKR